MHTITCPHLRTDPQKSTSLLSRSRIPGASVFCVRNPISNTSLFQCHLFFCSFFASFSAPLPPLVPLNRYAMKPAEDDHGGPPEQASPRSLHVEAARHQSTCERDGGTDFPRNTRAINLRMRRVEQVVLLVDALDRPPDALAEHTRRRLPPIGPPDKAGGAWALVFIDRKHVVYLSPSGAWRLVDVAAIPNCCFQRVCEIIRSSADRHVPWIRRVPTRLLRHLLAQLMSVNNNASNSIIFNTIIMTTPLIKTILRCAASVLNTLRVAAIEGQPAAAARDAHGVHTVNHPIVWVASGDPPPLAILFHKIKYRTLPLRPNHHHLHLHRYHHWTSVLYFYENFYVLHRLLQYEPFKVEPPPPRPPPRLAGAEPSSTTPSCDVAAAPHCLQPDQCTTFSVVASEAAVENYLVYSPMTGEALGTLRLSVQCCSKGCGHAAACPATLSNGYPVSVLRGRTVAEFKLLWKLRSVPGIVRIVGWRWCRDRASIAERLLDIVTQPITHALSDLHGILPADAVHILSRVAKCVECLHAMHIAHLRIALDSVASVRSNSMGAVDYVLTDLGAARRVAAAELGAFAADIEALGALLIALLNAFCVSRPMRLERLLHRCVDQDPSRRPSVADIVVELDEVTDTLEDLPVPLPLADVRVGHLLRTPTPFISRRVAPDDALPLIVALTEVFSLRHNPFDGGDPFVCPRIDATRLGVAVDTDGILHVELIGIFGVRTNDESLRCAEMHNLACIIEQILDHFVPLMPPGADATLQWLRFLLHGCHNPVHASAISVAQLGAAATAAHVASLTDPDADVGSG